MSEVAYRIFKTKYSDSWFDGKGAYLFGGRWNPPRTRVFYSSETLALATLEILVNVNDSSILSSFSYASIGFESSSVMKIEEIFDLPKNWRTRPLNEDTQAIGKRWYDDGMSLVLSVPTALLPLGRNYIFNVDHLDFPKLDLGKAKPIAIDDRSV